MGQAGGGQGAELRRGRAGVEALHRAPLPLPVACARIDGAHQQQQQPGEGVGCRQSPSPLAPTHRAPAGRWPCPRPPGFSPPPHSGHPLLLPLAGASGLPSPPLLHSRPSAQPLPPPPRFCPAPRRCLPALPLPLPPASRPTSCSLRPSCSPWWSTWCASRGAPRSPLRPAAGSRYWEGGGGARFGRAWGGGGSGTGADTPPPQPVAQTPSPPPRPDATLPTV